MDAMLTQEQYSYMQPLSAFREYLNNTVFDFTKRTWISRSIKDGHIAFGPDAYSPEYVQDLLRFALTIDRDELRASKKLGLKKPRFQIVSMRALIAIDAVWSLQAYTLPFAALKIFHDVYVKGIRFEVPVVAKVPKTPVPATRYIPCESWDEDARDDFGGLRSAILESLEGPCTTTQDILVKGEVRTVMDVDTGKMFEVHEESVGLLLNYELDHLVNRYHESARNAGKYGFGLVGEGYRYYVMLGAISLAKGQVGEVDTIMRRSSWRERHGLAGYNIDMVKARAMSLDKPLPVEMRKQIHKPSEAELREHARNGRRNAVHERRIPLDVLFREWAPNVQWHRINKRGLKLRRLMASSLQKGKKQYNPGLRKGWALHHFVRQGELVQFIKANPDVAQQVKAHRARSEKPGVQLDMFKA